MSAAAPAIEPEQLPAVFGVQTASRVLGIGKNSTYDLIRRGEYPVRVLDICGKLKVTRYDLLRYLGAEARRAGPQPTVGPGR